MASDYGDEAGGKLLDWMLRIGQEAGAEAMARSARELSERLAGIRGTIAGGRAEAIAADGAPDLCQDFGHSSSRNQAAIGMASGLGSVLSKKAAMASAGTL